MNHQEKLLEWALELHSIAQAGLYFGKDDFDIERFERIREISAEMISHKTEIPLDTVKNLFCKDIEGEVEKEETSEEIIEDLYDDEEY